MSAQALTAASTIKRTQGYVKEALDLSTQAVALDPKFSAGLSNHAVNLVITGNFKDGISYFQDAASANVRSAQPYWWMAVALRDAGQFKDAVTNFKIAITKIDNDNTLVGADVARGTKSLLVYDLAKTYWLAGNDADGLKTLDQAMQIDPGIKAFLKNDLAKYGNFKSLAGNAQFDAYLK